MLKIKVCLRQLTVCQPVHSFTQTNISLCDLSVLPELLIELCWCVIVNNTTPCNATCLLLLHIWAESKFPIKQHLNYHLFIIIYSATFAMLPVRVDLDYWNWYYGYWWYYSIEYIRSIVWNIKGSLYKGVCVTCVSMQRWVWSWQSGRSAGRDNQALPVACPTTENKNKGNLVTSA